MHASHRWRLKAKLAAKLAAKQPAELQFAMMQQGKKAC
jgi:hypothetical protein